MNCQRCGQETLMPFQCSYCGAQFCSQHRLPENHECPRIGVAYTQRQETVADSFAHPRNSYGFSVNFGQPRRVNGRVYFSQREIKHLIVGALLVTGVGLSYGLGAIWDSTAILVFSALAALLTVSFFTHEIAHKVIAQKQGYWAEFRLTTWGTIITVLTLFLPFKLISPGAVMISGPAKLEEIGKISIAGPATNIALSTVFLGAAFIPSSYAWIFDVGAFLNAYIAVFNLLPFGILDGFKIYSWNRKVWAATFALSAALAAVGYLRYPF